MSEPNEAEPAPVQPRRREPVVQSARIDPGVTGVVGLGGLRRSREGHCQRGQQSGADPRCPSGDPLGSEHAEAFSPVTPRSGSATDERGSQ